ncbi:hypothetical protein ACQP1O_43110 (plasmid) [Nocardia sp. CA-151230]|uniref:hypothetical protein n=1 Tax=Nocardia sp. CA-151230 TaxID=3239982 RepID=UPI003D8AE2AB
MAVVSPSPETVTRVQVAWEVLTDTGSVWSTSYKPTAEEAVAEVTERNDWLNAEIAAMTRDGIKHKMTPRRLAGVRCRRVTTVEIIETGEVQPISEFADAQGHRRDS